MKTIQSRIQHKRDTSSNWEQNNPVILAGEIIIVDTNAGEKRTKTGDGVKRYNDLPFDDEVIRNLVSSKDSETLQSAKEYTDNKFSNIQADDVKFTDGQNFQQKYDSGQLTGPAGADGSNGQDGSPGADGADGGYYQPTVDGSGNLSWTASKSGMPDVAGQNIRGPEGPQGPKGADGAKGDTGPQGPKGETGSQGLQGEQGPQGPAGDDKFYLATFTRSGDTYTCDRTFTDIDQQMQAGKSVMFTLANGGTAFPACYDFLGGVIGYWVYPTVWSNNEIGELTIFSIGISRDNTVGFSTRLIVGSGASLTGTDYTVNRPRGMAFQSSTPSSIPNGCSVGVYE